MQLDHLQSVKEIGRHVLYRSGLSGALAAFRSRRGYKVAHLHKRTAAERFSAIYAIGAWRHSDGQNSLSGEGSEAAATATIANELPAVLAELECKTFLDVGCGDWNWMRNVHLPCDYIGIDIVPEVIAANRIFERSGVSFAVGDSIVGPLPKADVAFCREILFHLSFRDAKATLANVRKSALWLIATTDTSTWFNSDIATGDFRKINLERRPYRVPKPRRIILDGALSRGRVLGLWKTTDLTL